MSAEQPNILLITTDQQRYDSAGHACPPFMRTPHFDHLAREGITFSRAYSDCPLCVPARISIMTGRTIAAHGMTGNGPTAPHIDRRTSLPSRLRDAGYQTAAIGKMHFGPERSRHGFDEMILPDDYYHYLARLGPSIPQPMRHGLGQNELYPTLATVPESLTLTNWIAQQCVEYVRRRRDPVVPFFLWCSFSKPHPPLDPPEPYYSMYRDCDIPNPAIGDWSAPGHAPAAFERHRQQFSFDLLDPQIIRAARTAYLGLITQIDYNIGRLFAALQDLDLFEQTLIIYSSDHGEYLGDHLAGAKTFFHEPSAHVPLLLRLPKSWPDRGHGSTCDALVTHADIMPTLLSAAGANPADNSDGLDLTRLARGQAQPREYLESIAGHPDRPIAQIAITDGRWKYLYFPEGPAEQLFDLQTDPRELRNLAGQAPAAGELARLRGELLRRHQARGSQWAADGRLVELPVREETVADRRNRSWPGYHTENYDKDVRH